MTTRLNIHSRKQIVVAALKHAFTAREEELKTRGHVLAQDIYNHFIPASEAKAARKLAKIWWRTSNCFGVSIRNCIHKVETAKPVVIPQVTGYVSIGELSLPETSAEKIELIKRFDLLQQAREQLRDDKREAETGLWAVLNSVSTIGALATVWPNGKPFFDHLKSAPAMPAIRTQDLDKKLGLAA